MICINTGSNFGKLDVGIKAKAETNALPNDKLIDMGKQLLNQAEQHEGQTRFVVEKPPHMTVDDVADQSIAQNAISEMVDSLKQGGVVPTKTQLIDAINSNPDIPE